MEQLSLNHIALPARDPQKLVQWCIQKLGFVQKGKQLWSQGTALTLLQGSFRAPVRNRAMKKPLLLALLAIGCGSELSRSGGGDFASLNSSVGAITTWKLDYPKIARKATDWCGGPLPREFQEGTEGEPGEGSTANFTMTSCRSPWMVNRRRPFLKQTVACDLLALGPSCCLESA